ncbi:MarR family winged helix-turn-helix transcriptional regulator [Ureibacillus endophyticus]|uniref:MarR family transcriptional regulator n=1 Tax=Ureibacillus endophyticus TaxID=1978490 RepID=A0A494Z2M1_9BACL|nr:MarR family transcriptional regulator [Lysinibacillus endophyticus]RKQ16748.1 MarR family transcriptional regulator [Lysinibacillus endophyticus]
MNQHQQVFHNLVFTLRPFDTQLSEILRNHGIQRSEWSVLYSVVHEPDITAAELAKRLTFEKPNMTRIIKVLTNAGYIEVETSSGDKRRKNLRITPLGKEKYLEARVEIDAFEKEILEGISAEDQIHLLRTLEQIHTNLNKKTGLY